MSYYKDKVYTNEDLEKYMKEFECKKKESYQKKKTYYPTYSSKPVFQCGKKYYCSQMSSCEEAMFYYNDIEITNRIISACEIIGIRVLDHIIIGDNNYFSFFNEGLIKEV